MSRPIISCREAERLVGASGRYTLKRGTEAEHAAPNAEHASEAARNAAGKADLLRAIIAAATPQRLPAARERGVKAGWTSQVSASSAHSHSGDS